MHPVGSLTRSITMHISLPALQASVTERLGSSSPAPHFDDGYQTWRAAVAKGEAGVFSIPVREAVAYFESMINASQ